MSDRWDAALEFVEREMEVRVVSAEVLRALEIVRDDESFGPVAMEHIARMVEALPHDLREVRRVLCGGAL